jgi:hypothetical protein
MSGRGKEVKKEGRRNFLKTPGTLILFGDVLV